MQQRGMLLLSSLQKILDAQQSQFEFAKRVDDLEKQISAAVKKSEQFARYLRRTMVSGMLAYEFRGDAANGERIRRALRKRLLGM